MRCNVGRGAASIAAHDMAIAVPLRHLDQEVAASRANASGKGRGQSVGDTVGEGLGPMHTLAPRGSEAAGHKATGVGLRFPAACKVTKRHGPGDRPRGRVGVLVRFLEWCLPPRAKPTRLLPSQGLVLRSRLFRARWSMSELISRRSFPGPCRLLDAVGWGGGERSATRSTSLLAHPALTCTPV